MGYFFDFLTGGNIKIAASSLAKLHFSMNGDYLLTYQTRINSLIQHALDTNTEQHLPGKLAFPPKGINQICEYNIRNYTDLVILDLNMNAAPVTVTYDETYSSFAKEVETYLIRKNINQLFVCGDNSNLTYDYIRFVREFFIKNNYYIRGL